MYKGLTRIKEFYNKHAVLLKMIFIFSVLLFVFTELGKIFHQLNWHQVGVALSDQSPIVILVMLICGIIAVCPMLIYDFVIVKFLPGNFSKKYIARSGWVTNTFTNIAGFGGLLGATLRASFYKKGANRKQILYAISKIALFLLAGLSILCWVSLIMMFILPSENGFHKYSIWLLGGGAYFPILFLVTKFKNNSFFKDLTWKREFALILGSTIEWACAALFFMIIGWLMQVHIHLIDVIPLYIIAEILGIISMVPGGLGSFDVFMILELTKLGVSSEIAVVWILFFRLFYYVVPFLIGSVFFVHDMGHQINESLDGIPQTIVQKVAHGLVTLFMYFSGIFMLLESAIPNFTFSNSILARLVSYTFFFLNQMTNIIFAFLLLGMARAIQLKQKKAFIPTIIILGVGVINTLWKEYTPTLAVFLVFVMICIVFSRKELYREKMQFSFESILLNMLMFGGAFLLYMLVGLLNRPTNHHHIPSGLLFPDQQVWLYGLIGMIIAGIILVVMMHYFTKGKDPFINQKFPEKRVTQIIESYGGNEVSHLAYLKDKMIYIYRKDNEDQLFLMYQIKADKIIIMGEPVGNQDYIQEAVHELVILSDRYGYQLVFYEINSELTMLLHEYGFDFIKTGEEGFVKLDEFTIKGKKHRAQRALMNKFDREGFIFSIVEPPFSNEFIAEMKEVSDSWLNGRMEKGFSLGFFDKNYIQRTPVAIVRDKNGKLVSFATLMPMEKNTLSIDLMRHRKDAPSGIMDKIFIELFSYGQSKGYKYFDLGMAPLSNVGSSKYSFIEERVAHYIYEYGYRLYGFQGLRAFKNKYANIWNSKYTTYRKRSSIAITMFQLVMVVNQKHGQKEFSRMIITPKFLQNK
ncbi:bifunctional lysylphosphatidylglycerol flippase/synthetase MprF [Ligilactobacillus cholophilus]|uniref:bifunctional lysylphosphatidylglycerol flippase/synthetase MprF n=1 Tax=Ligilactobacillus cholophilus TaxID=3050131 RepID=UPI0025B11381|nr:bifunctional lysylphosphatidylglycerol flippase/synthetase MprF [Ligilactobacillus cholophilus]